MTRWLLLVIGITNLLAFALMGADKVRAAKGKRRIPERTLFLFPVLGGGLGGVLGMLLFHHKTRKWYFPAGFFGLTILEIAALAWLMAFSGLPL